MKHHSSHDELTWRLKVLKARILVSRSQNKEALELLREDLPHALDSTDLPEQRKLYRGLAHRGNQQFVEAGRDFEEAELLVGSLPTGYKCQLFIAEAAMQVDLRNYKEANASYDKALSIAREEKAPILEVNVLANLGRLAASEEHFDQAVELNQEGLRLSKSLNTQGNTATLLGNLAWSYFELGDFVNALEYYKTGAENSEKTGLIGNSVYWLTGVANSSKALHDYVGAEKLAQDTLNRGSESNHGQVMVESLNILSEVALITGRLEEADRRNQQARKLEEGGIDQFGTLESRLQTARIELKKHHFGDAESLFQGIIEEPTAESPLKWEAEAKLADIKDERGLTVEADRGYRKAIERIETSRSSIDHEDLRISFLSTGIQVYGEYIDFLMRHGRNVEALNLAELSRARTLAEGLASTAEAASGPSRHYRPQETARNLDASLLFYWIGQSNSYLWVITPAKTSNFKLPPASTIEPVVAAYRKAILQMRDANDEGSADGKKLYAMLVEPAKKMIPPGSRVIVLPSESLYGLNFETLIVPDPQPHFWIEDVTLTTGTSLTMLAGSAAKPLPKDRSLFLVGDTKPPNPPFAPLPQAAAEMKQVKKYFSGAQTRVLEGVNATPSAFLKSNPEQFSYLHFVTHGTASHTRPLESAVILSQEGDSYKLYARDIVQHRLKANLVTISACNGAGTRAYAGEGLVGLSWAFLRAGAHNVVGALWEVSDASTPQLMDAFYRALFQGKDTATALRDAKLGLLHSADADSVYKNPFYWAPFQLYAGS
jgi:CHAT domain-containing protein